MAFTYWTAVLGLLQFHLEGKNIEYLRIDGRVRYKQRLAIWRHYKGSDIPVISMSTQSDAVG